MGVSGLLTFLRDGRNSLSTTKVLSTTVSAESAPDQARDDAGEEDDEKEIVSLVIDGWAFIWSLYNDNLPWATGGEYHAVSLLIDRVVTAWKLLGIQAYFVFDGPTPLHKHDLVLSRYASALRTSQLFHLTSLQTRSSPKFCQSSTILPPLILPCVLSTLQSLGFQPGFNLFVLPEGEADGFCVSLAGELKGGRVISNDSDMVILGAGNGGEGYGGFVPTDMIQWTLEAVEGDTGDGGERGRNGDGDRREGEEEDGFAPVKSSRRNRKNGITSASTQKALSTNTAFSQHLLPPPFPTSDPTNTQGQTFRISLQLPTFLPSSLASRLRIPASHLPLLATLLGNDHSPAEAPGLFFDSKLARWERIELVGRRIRECGDVINGAGAGKKGKIMGKRNGGNEGVGRGKPGMTILDDGLSTATSVKSSPKEEATAGDHACDFIRSVIASLLIRPLQNETQLDRLVAGMVEATCHYILPPSPLSLDLFSDDRLDGGGPMESSSISLRIPRDGRCCARHPYCACLDADRRCPMWTCRCYALDEDTDEFRPAQTPCNPDFHDRSRARFARSRNAGHMTSFSAFMETDRSYLASMLEHPEGIPLRSSEHSRMVRKLAWEIVCKGMGLFGSRGGFRVEVGEETGSPADTTPTLDELAQSDVVMKEDTVTEDTTSPFTVWEFMRSGSSVKMDAFPLELALETSISGDDVLPFDILEQPYSQRLAVMRRILHSDTETIRAVSFDHQLLVILLRTAIRRAGSAGKVKSTSRLWTQEQVIRSIISGLVSLELWGSGIENTKTKALKEDELLLETAACGIVSQVTAASLDILALGQALLLSESEKDERKQFEDDNNSQAASSFRLHMFQEGTIWHRNLSAIERPHLSLDREAMVSRVFQAITEDLQDHVLGWKADVALPIKNGKKGTGGGGKERLIPSSPVKTNGKGKVGGNTKGAFGVLDEM